MGVTKFTGESKPDTWLEDYRVAVQIGGGNNDVAMKHLPLMLEGPARAWLNQLALGNIFSWEELARVFIKTFEGTCKRPAGLSELQHCVQKQNETLRDFIQRWTTLHHTVEKCVRAPESLRLQRGCPIQRAQPEIRSARRHVSGPNNGNSHSVC